MATIFVVGRFTGTTYGPFHTEAEARAFIRAGLGSNDRYYDTATAKPRRDAVPAHIVAAMARRRAGTAAY